MNRFKVIYGKKRVNYKKKEILELGKTIKITETTSPWFIKWLNNKPIITLHDFNDLVGFKVKSPVFFLDKLEDRISGVYVNGYGQGEGREEFEKRNNIHYEEETFLFYTLVGFKRALRSLRDSKKINNDKYKNIIDLAIIEKKKNITMKL